jgi:alkanesulfonate monooxygenase SsuD/methylene tetrahydromethanopterin reductase-like flavin-dependent oxidoreductase (luciferase family)
MTPEWFPVLLHHDLPRTWPLCPTMVPWALVEPHERQARANHYQTLARLAERGGLDPCELWAVVHDMAWEKAPPISECVAWLQALGNAASS